MVWDIVIQAALSNMVASQQYKTALKISEIDIKNQQLLRQQLSKSTQKPKTNKCSCCGARDWKEYEGVMICTYCRSEQ